MLFEPTIQRFAQRLRDESFYFGIQKFFFELIVKGRIRQLDADDTDQSFAQVVAAGRRSLVFENTGSSGELVDRARQRYFEALRVGAAVNVVDIVGKRQQCFVVTIEILQDQLADKIVLFFF